MPKSPVTPKTDGEVEQLAKTIGRAISRHRLAKDLTQEAVAEQLGIGNEAVSRIERGIVMPTVGRLAELANIFQCDTSDLLLEASNRVTDQAHHLAQLLSRLNGADREMVLEMVEKLVARLAVR